MCTHEELMHSILTQITGVLTVYFFPSGADITDYFNYGFTEDTWKQYCEKQRRMRMELTMQKKIYVRHKQLMLLNHLISVSLQYIIFLA